MYPWILGLGIIPRNREPYLLIDCIIVFVSVSDHSKAVRNGRCVFTSPCRTLCVSFNAIYPNACENVRPKGGDLAQCLIYVRVKRGPDGHRPTNGARKDGSADNTEADKSNRSSSDEEEGGREGVL